ncbi:MAG: RnfABCDGE type electron transport complex subunit D [bacterium]|nr:RnfABCDGE type electron transport complex subunit D [bacterium]
MADHRLVVTEPPHLTSGESVRRAMLDVLLALGLVTLVSLYYFRWNAALLISVSLLTAVIVDLIAKRIKGRPLAFGDGSVLVTGLLVALCLPPLAGWWVAVFATALAVGVAKEWMGGLGWNRFNPAAFGRAGVILLWEVTVWLNQQLATLRLTFPVSPVVADAVTGATPLALLKRGLLDVSYGQLLVAYPGGALGETSAIALLAGGLYLVYRKHICWRVPAAMIGSVVVFSALFGSDPFYHVLTGGLLLGAFFMATDWVTSPITDRGKILFGVLIGLLVVVFRVFLASTESVVFSILIMNAFVPVIDRVTRRRKFGQVSLTRTA